MKKLSSLLLAFALVLGLSACGTTSTANSSVSSAVESSTAANASASIVADASTPDTTEINMAVLAGPTGIGASELMNWNDAGKTANHYNFTVATANDDVVAGLANGEFDIAAVATNVAANLYQKTSGKVQICALNTYGVLYILENGESVNSVADLAGKTIYATGQGANPEYVLNYILSENGLIPGEDVTIEFMDSESLVTKMAAGEIDLCMLPVPAVTSVQMQNSDVRVALDLTAEWNNIGTDGALTMGCVVVRTAFAEEHPDAVTAFLTEYAESIEAVQTNVEEASQFCEQYGIVAKAAVAAKAIPACNLCFISGDKIQSAIEPYYKVLYSANPASIGGNLPDDNFYFTDAKK